MNVEEILEDRGGVHGDFIRKAATIQSMKDAMRNKEGNWDCLPDFQKEALDAIVAKMGRIIYGKNNFLDHWVDIIGYVSLVIKGLKEKRREINVK